MKLTTIGILSAAVKCFTSARKALIEGAGYLHKISAERLYEGKYSSFAEYLEQECQISEGTASKLIKVYQHYVVDGKVSPAKLRAVDSEKLYLALRLDGEPEAQILRAQTWTRDELREELRDEKNGEHDCEMNKDIKFSPCKHCGRLLRYE